jgi:hypothetical protein
MLNGHFFYHREICYVYLIKPNNPIVDYSTAIKLQPNFLAAYQERVSINYAIEKNDLEYEILILHYS